MAIDTKHEELQGLRIDRSDRGQEGEPSSLAKRIIIGGISLVVILGLGGRAHRLFASNAPRRESARAYPLFASNAPEVETARATVESSGDSTAGIVLTATGYIVAHHKIEANSKVTGRVAWIGVEKGDKVKEGQVLVRLEDQEFRAQYEQAEGAAESARAQLLQLQNGSRPEEIQQTEHNLSEARATAANDKISLDRAKNLAGQGV